MQKKRQKTWQYYQNVDWLHYSATNRNSDCCDDQQNLLEHQKYECEQGRVVPLPNNLYLCEHILGFFLLRTCTWNKKVELLLQFSLMIINPMVTGLKHKHCWCKCRDYTPKDGEE